MPAKQSLLAQKHGFSASELENSVSIPVDSCDAEKRKETGSVPLTNKRHERFALELAKGASQTAAYLAAGYDGDRTAASKLATKCNVIARVEWLQRQAATQTVLTMAERREFLAAVLRTPAGTVTHDSPLVQEVEIDGNKMRLKMPSKLKALELDAKLAGDFEEKVDMKLQVEIIKSW